MHICAHLHLQVAFHIVRYCNTFRNVAINTHFHKSGKDGMFILDTQGAQNFGRLGRISCDHICHMSCNVTCNIACSVCCSCSACRTHHVLVSVHFMSYVPGHFANARFGRLTCGQCTTRGIYLYVPLLTIYGLLWDQNDTVHTSCNVIARFHI